MRITVDTNVLISATFWFGASFKILELVENDTLELVLSEGILQEYSQVLYYKEIQDKIRSKNLVMKHTIEKIRQMATMVEPKENLSVVKEDPDDDRILECAVAGDVDYIVSQDNHLLKLKQFVSIPILKPEVFLDLIRR